MIDLARLDALREAMLNDEDLGRILRRFLDDFGDDPEFVRRGFAVSEPDLEMLVLEVLERAMGRRFLQATFRLIRLAPTSFVHGVLLLEGRPGNLLWFEDEGVGLVTLLTRAGGEHVRFRAFFPDPHAPDEGEAGAERTGPGDP